MTRNYVTILLVAMLVLTATVAGCGSKVTKENFGKIKVDMTEAEVTDILGEATETTGGEVNLGGLKAGGKIMVWKDGDKSIQVTIANGKVAAVTSTGL